LAELLLLELLEVPYNKAWNIQVQAQFNKWLVLVWLWLAQAQQLVA
jgi:hypothetical protein